MANQWYFLLLIMASLVLCQTMQAAVVTHVVGDDQGWRLDFNYSVWAQGKKFSVGDTLVFKYANASHIVYQVDGAGFKDCINQTNLKTFRSGNDEIELTKAGKYWFICVVGIHCADNMKVVITATEKAEASGPGATGPSSLAPPRCYTVNFYMFAIAAIISCLAITYMFL